MSLETEQLTLWDLQPTQFYLLEDKVEAVRRIFDPEHPERMEPLAVKHLHNRWILADGHARAWVALEAGVEKLPLVVDHHPVDWDLYILAVDAARKRGVKTIRDLSDRILPASRYEEAWDGWREQTREVLELQRERRARGERAESVVFTNMCMIEDEKGRVVVQNRLDPGWSGFTFPGGHVEPGEPFIPSVIREIKEETGLDIEHPELCGMKHFLNHEGARYLILFYKTRTFSGELHGSAEGSVFWAYPEDLDPAKMTPDFEAVLPIFLGDTPAEGCYLRDDSGEEVWTVYR